MSRKKQQQPATVEADPIPAGSIWLEKKTKRKVRITWSTPHDHPANGFTYDEWFEHRCDAYDFLVWGRFERVS